MTFWGLAVLDLAALAFDTGQRRCNLWRCISLELGTPLPDRLRA
jgi:hypothetical protein